jgi:imidazolonepropionase-like amidohydrolase
MEKKRRRTERAAPERAPPGGAAWKNEAEPFTGASATASASKVTIFQNANLLDTSTNPVRLLAGRSVKVVGGIITEVSDEPIVLDKDFVKDKELTVTVLDLKGKVLMPGLCDAHVHVNAASADFSALDRWPTTYATIRATEVLREMLMRGFTTVRDAGGADHGLAQGIAEGRVVGPRLLFSGHALSQTGGHADMRSAGEEQHASVLCAHGLGVVCDGVTEMRRACRQEIRKGATQIKLMVSGGVASPTDRIDSTQFGLDEIRAAVEECTAANVYVMAHAYTARAIKRALECGVKSIEHGNLLDDESLEIFTRKGAFLVPTLSTYSALNREGLEYGLPPSAHAKVASVLGAGLEAVARAHKAGVKLVYGTDLLGGMHRYQLQEFWIRTQVQSISDVIRSATVVAAELFGMDGKLGVVAVGAHADLIVLGGNPLQDLSVLAGPCELVEGGGGGSSSGISGRALLAVMKGGVLLHNQLT